MYYCAVDSKSPEFVKAIVFTVLAYFVSPIDFIIDYIPVLGYTDDTAIMLFSFCLIHKHVTEEHWVKTHWLGK
ncbi:DUF1232 domain-containing protein [Paenibacillus sp. P26]|nr:DUF1232 domain-containing protein [Paenibacillus sp. P26]UUZ97498.1 DUF1232 domain-containing protein [Paenibacillus sp. P25]